MKQFAFCIMTAVLVTVLSGCGIFGSKNDTNIALSPQLNYTFAAVYNEMEVKGTLNISGDDATVTVSEPAALSGMKVVSNESGMTVTYLGITKKLDASSIPQTAFVPLLIDSITSARESGSGTNVDGGYEIAGKYENNEYTIAMDKEFGLCSLSMPDYGLKVSFEKS